MGEAGAGKTFCLKTLVNMLRHLKLKVVVVTASTGTAACRVCGQTAHSTFKLMSN